MNNNGIRRNHFLKLILLFILAAFAAHAQKKVPLLERSITVSLQNESMETALKKIGQAGNFTFSYKSTLIKNEERVNANFNNITVREILDELFKGSIEYKERGRYIILVKGNKSASTGSSTLSGYVIDEASGKRLKNVSVYDPVSLSSTVTDSYGYFKIDIKNPTSDEIKLAVKRKEYADTVVVVAKGNKRLLNVPIKLKNLNREKIETLADSVGERIKRFWLNTKAATEQAVNMENISDSIHRTFQFSLIPFAGTNGKLSGNVINDYSVNLFGGHSLGNNIIEVGGLFNTNRGNVKGFQAAGLFNGMMGKQNGAQVAGLANATYDSANGFQAAGLTNVNFSFSDGLKVAGLLNLGLEDSHAVQVAGLGNIVLGESRGPQLAGLFNISTLDAGPAQIAGLFNFTGGAISGLQLSGFGNFTDHDVVGAQVSGVVNVAPKSMRGAQVGLMNIANTFDGIQLGFLNISNRMNGVPIGFISIVGKGYHKLEISADEVFYANIAFRTGLRQFYNILTVGSNPKSFKDDKTLWTFGYGVGTAPKLSKNIYLNFDLTCNQIVSGNNMDEIHLLNKLYGGFDFQLAKNFSFTAGITLNGLLTDTTYDQYPEIFSDYVPNILHEENLSHDLNLKMWLGGKVGFRFF